MAITKVSRDLLNTSIVDNGNATAITIDSSENVGIGTGSPNQMLELSANNGSGVANVLRFNDADTGVSAGQTTGRIEFSENDGGDTTVSAFLEVETVATTGGGIMTFGTGAAGVTADEKIRIDSSGNLLVGKTSNDIAVNGVKLGTTGVNVTRDNDVMVLNRTSSNGTLLGLWKDGTVVGSIGTQSGTDFYITGSTAIATGLRFQANEIVPVNGSAGNVDAAIDLGKSNIRFKDLYLSGGAYLGGTGAANLLDDYEEGTWTPVTNSGSWTVNSATYTKVGNMVTCRFKVTATATIEASDLYGLPFTPASEAAGVCGYQNSEASVVFSIAVQTSSVWNLRVGSTQKGLTNGALIYGIFTYHTTA
jgi:hypothetical protein